MLGMLQKDPDFSLPDFSHTRVFPPFFKKATLASEGQVWKRAAMLRVCCLHAGVERRRVAARWPRSTWKQAVSVLWGWSKGTREGGRGQATPPPVVCGKNKTLRHFLPISFTSVSAHCALILPHPEGVSPGGRQAAGKPAPF